MKNFILITLLIFNISSIAQNENQFDFTNFENQFIAYKPIKSPNVSQKDFNYATMIVKETKKATKNNPKNFNIADYFNILSAFLSLKESEQNIKIAYVKFKKTKGSCEYIVSFEKSIGKNPKYDIIRDDYNKELAKCKAKTTSNKAFDISEYCMSNNLDLALVKKINIININDQKYRTKSSVISQTKQQELDKQNQKNINSLFKIHKSYIGRTLVGEKFENVMWAVIQHSNLEMMERYLPIVQIAVSNNELSNVPFKMLIDRFYGFKYGYQIFGSQKGIKLADGKKRKEIELKYNIK